MLHFLIAMYRVPYTCTIYHLALSYLSAHTYFRLTNFLFLPLDGAHKRVGRDTRSFNSRRSSTDSSEDGVVGGVGGVLLVGLLGHSDSLPPPPPAGLLQVVIRGTIAHQDHRNGLTLLRSTPSGEKWNYITD